MWVDYWGAKGYVGPPLKLYAPPCPPPPLPTPMQRGVEWVDLFKKKEKI